jgi:hypothetical protein
MNTITVWQPTWANDTCADTNPGAWDRIKRALLRDWQQTKHDLGLGGGKELNQSARDTLKQATRAQAIPPSVRTPPVKVSGRWIEARCPLAGEPAPRPASASRRPTWNEGIEQRLRTERNALVIFSPSIGASERSS